MVGNITRAELLALFALLVLAGCGEAGNQPGSAAGKAGESTRLAALCPAIGQTGLAGQCTLDMRENVVHVTIDSNDDETAREVCAAIATKTSPQSVELSGHWALQVFSPYRSDKPLAECAFR